MEIMITNNTGKLYTELAEDLQEKAREWFRNTSEFDGDLITEMIEIMLDDAGYGNLDDINYSLSYCQGDGVAFYGKLYDSDVMEIADRLLDTESLEILKDLCERTSIVIDIYRNSFGYRYSHYGTMGLTIEIDDIETTVDEEEVLTLLETLVLEDIRNLSKECEKAAYEDIEYRNSDEYIEEELIINEYRFEEKQEDLIYI